MRQPSHAPPTEGSCAAAASADGVEHLEAALAQFTDLHATPFAARCEAELGAAGVAHLRLADPQLLQLTLQEMAVARMVAAGRRNQEIADEMVPSVKTVNYHLGHVFTRLGIRSRTDLAATWTSRRATQPESPAQAGQIAAPPTQH